MDFNHRYRRSTFLRGIQIFLLALIIIGVGLLFTQKYWVPKLVSHILGPETETSYDPSVDPVDNISTTPTETPTKTPTPAVVPPKLDSGVSGNVTIGPTCPVVREPADPNCADKPYKTTLVISSNIPGRGTGILVYTDGYGHFSQLQPPGTYTIRSQSDSVMPRLNPVTYEVMAHKVTTVDLVFDSGIR